MLFSNTKTISTNAKNNLHLNTTPRTITVYNAISWDPDTGHNGRSRSFCIKDFFYNEATSTLLVIFNDGEKRQYFHISFEEAKSLERAPSKGRFVLRTLKKKPHRRIN